MNNYLDFYTCGTFHVLYTKQKTLLHYDSRSDRFKIFKFIVGRNVRSVWGSIVGNWVTVSGRWKR